MVPHIKTPTQITAHFEDGPVTVHKDDPRYEQFAEAISSGDADQARRIAFRGVAIQEQLDQTQPTANVQIADGVVYFDKQPLHTTLTYRMVQMLEEGFDVTPMSNFLERLMQNPSYRAVDELYDFLEASSLPITQDGCFLAYKVVRANYTDVYSGKFDNSIGQVVEMPRNQVDDRKENTCSNGLHFCAYGYLTFYMSMHADRVVVVKVDPADVVSIPADHNNQKGRTCRYRVINEIEDPRTAMTEGALEGSVDRYFDPDVEDHDSIEDFDELDIEEEDFFGDGIDVPFSGSWDHHKQPTQEGEQSLSDDAYLKTHPEAVLQIDPRTGDRVARYQTPGQADVRTQIPEEYIRRVARGNRNTSGGYGWIWLAHLPPALYRQGDAQTSLQAAYFPSWPGWP